MRKGMINLWVREQATSASEYSVMLALIVLVAAGAITALGTRINEFFTQLQVGMG